VGYAVDSEGVGAVVEVAAGVGDVRASAAKGAITLGESRLRQRLDR
jgi:hypothetical protein